MGIFSFPLKRWIMLALVVGAAFFSSLMAPGLPAQLVTHWGMDGQPNGWMSKTFALLFMPILMAAMYVLIVVLPGLEPHRERHPELRRAMESFGIVLLVFMLYVHVVTLTWNRGWHFDLVRWIIPGISGLLFALGYFMQTVPQNYFLGIRTPWTLQDDRVWKETHRVGARVFEVAAIISLFGIVVPRFAFWFLFVPILVAALVSVMYSYQRYQAWHPPKR